jgi:hypothetical protein
VGPTPSRCDELAGDRREGPEEGAWEVAVGDMPKSPSSQYGLKAQEDIDPRGIRVTNGSMR